MYAVTEIWHINRGPKPRLSNSHGKKKKRHTAVCNFLWLYICVRMMQLQPLYCEAVNGLTKCEVGSLLLWCTPTGFNICCLFGLCGRRR